MKRTMKIAFVLLLVLLTGSAFTSAQGKKEKQRIMVVISGKDGKNVMIDTTFSTSEKVDTILLKNGKMIFTGTGGDFSYLTEEKGDKKVIVISEGKDITAEDDMNLMTWVDSDDGDREKVIIIKKTDKPSGKEEISYDVTVKTGDPGRLTEKTSYVIAKGGITVNIEGDNEEKIRELAGFIEEKLGVSKSEGGTVSPGIK